MSEYIVRMPPDMPYEIRAELNAWYVESEPIVRCRDCVHYKPYRTDKYGMMNRCHDEHGHTHKRDENDFCSRGERRSEQARGIK